MAQRIKSGGTTVLWDSKKLEKEVALKVNKKLKLAAETLVTRVKKNISIGRPASKPREFPHVGVTGDLRKSIFWDMRGEDTAIVGSSIIYSVFLELGTVRMAPRPFLGRSLREHRPKIKQIFAK